MKSNDVPFPQSCSSLPAHRAAPRFGTHDLIGDSAPMQAVKQTLHKLLDAERRVSDGEPPAVVILGETGTGKEVVARYLHRCGARAKRPFVELNCAAIPAALLESELFGHEKGAFTDARERKRGLVDAAEGGTLFLDEIGDMDLGLQSKLLKLLEEKRVRAVGSLHERQIDVRIIAATHQPLERLVKAGRFRADLYFRLMVIPVHLPPLRARGADVMLLADAFLAQMAARYGRPTPRLSPAARHRLLRHDWPGNVRELRNLVEQLVLLGESSLIDLDDLPALGMATAQTADSHPSDDGATRAADAPDAAPGTGGFSADDTQPTLAQTERSALLNALTLCHWNVSRAARHLGISRDTLRYRLAKHDLKNGGPSGGPFAGASGVAH